MIKKNDIVKFFDGSFYVAGVVRDVHKDIDTPYGKRMIWYATVDPFFNDNTTICLPIIRCEKIC